MMKTFSVLKQMKTMPTPTSEEKTQVGQDIQAEIIGAVSKATTEDAGFSSAEKI